MENTIQRGSSLTEINAPVHLLQTLKCMLWLFSLNFPGPERDQLFSQKSLETKKEKIGT